ncbi:MAG: hypothetical protein WCT42_01990 [Candidatus Paceibacterota bacterium]
MEKYKIQSAEIKKDEPAVESQLSLEEAHDLANMMRAKIGVSPSSTSRIESKEGEPYRTERGEIRYEENRKGREVHKEDYEEALKSLEELEKLADEEKPSKEALYKAARIIQAGGQILFGSLGAAGVVLSGSPKQMSQLFDSLKASRNQLIDDKKKWSDLIKAGDKFGKNEGK